MRSLSTSTVLPGILSWSLVLVVACARGSGGESRVRSAATSAGAQGGQIAGAMSQVDSDRRIARALANLTDPALVRGEPIHYESVADRMARAHVPGVSIAVADAGRIVWAGAFGVRNANTEQPMTPHTVFQAASVSKSIAATGALRLVQAGLVDLDADVNRYLSSWRVPETELTRREKVTLRRVMSHRAGVARHSFISYREGSALPTLVQMLEGTPPANNEPVIIDTVPGTQMQYSGGGVLIEMLVVTDILGISYADAMEHWVLTPFGMRDSTFELPLSTAHRENAASAHDSLGRVYEGDILMVPQLAAGGLWSTPSDLLAWAIHLAEAEADRSPELLAQPLAALMTHRVSPEQPVALGTFVWGEGNGRYFWHGGKSEGYTCEVLYFPEAQQGAAIMTNGDTGGELLGSVVNAIAQEYGWVGFAPQLVDDIGDAASNARLVGRYVTERPTVIELEVTLDSDALFFESAKYGIRSKGVVTGPREVTILNQPMMVLPFGLNADGTADRIFLGDIELSRRSQ